MRCANAAYLSRVPGTYLVPKGKTAGFTLVEVMTAMAILVVGMSTILGLLSFGLALHRNSSEKSQAGIALSTVISELESKLFIPEKGTTPTEPKEMHDQPVPGYPGLSYSAVFRENSKLPGEYLAEIEISWKEKGRKRSQVFRTIVLQEIPFAQRMKAMSEVRK